MANQRKNRKEDLDALEALSLENQIQNEEEQVLETIKPLPKTTPIAKQNKQEQSEENYQNQTTSNNANRPNKLDGWVKLERHELPQEGVLYPESWQFAYRCPTAQEVANFSTINDQDQIGIINVVEDMIRKCVIIYDTDKEVQIPNGEICDAHRMFFLLKIRSQYLPGKDIIIDAYCQECQKVHQVALTAESLIYQMPNDKLINAYDGRIFTLEMGLENPVVFRVPTLETTGRLYKYIAKMARNQQQGSDKKQDNVIYEKQFLLLAPYLFITGKETVRDITLKYKMIKRNDALFTSYLEIVNRIKLENDENFAYICPDCESEEEAQIKFPGGWKKLFISNRDTTGYFD